MPWKPDYATKVELANYVRADATFEDANLQLAVTSASRAIDRATNRQFGQVALAEVRKYIARANYRRGRWYVRVDDFQDVAGLVVSVDGTVLTELTLEPVNALLEGRPYEQITFGKNPEKTPGGYEADVSVTAKWGWLSVPTTVKQATLLQGSRFFERMKSPYGVAGSPETGSEIRLLARADPDVALMVKSYMRDRVTIG